MISTSFNQSGLRSGRYNPALRKHRISRQPPKEIGERKLVALRIATEPRDKLVPEPGTSSIALL